MKIVPQNNYVLCKCITENKKTLASGFIYETNDVSLYEIIDISKNFKNTALQLNIGDIIRTNSSGTKVKNDDGEFVLFECDSIVGKIINDV